MIARGRLLEVVNGIEIREKVPAGADPLALVAGRRGRLVTGGQVYEVDRVGAGAAYVHKVYDPPLIREWGDVPARDEALAKLLSYVTEGRDDGSSARRLTQDALRAARKVRKIAVTTGPVEPGIALAARFVERVG